jgi:hypothetical protein
MTYETISPLRQRMIEDMAMQPQLQSRASPWAAQMEDHRAFRSPSSFADLSRADAPFSWMLALNLCRCRPRHRRSDQAHAPSAAEAVLQGQPRLQRRPPQSWPHSEERRSGLP